LAGRPNNTTYAILGLLATRDWAAYELTKEMQRSLRYFWPRAESAVYVELGKLRSSGHVRAREEHRGKRTTTIYSITGKGRTKFQKWLDKGPRRGVQLESEGILRIFASPSAGPDPETVSSGIEAIRADADAMLQKSFQVGGDYLEGVAPFQHQIRWRVFVHMFVANYSLMLAEWCDWAEEELDRWESADEEKVKENALAAFTAVRERLNAYAELHGKEMDSPS
jgi:PadR family transcriptional regulator, regulatory protein AphA